MLSSPKFSNRLSTKRSKFSKKDESLSPSQSSKKSNVLLSVTNSVVSKSPMLLADVVTTEDVLNEEGAKTASRKMMISRPIDHSPYIAEDVSSMERQFSATDKEAPHKDTNYHKPSETFKFQQSLSEKRIKHIKTVDVGRWGQVTCEVKVNVGAPVLAISSTGSAQFVSCCFDGWIRVHNFNTGQVVSSVKIFPGVDNRHKFQAAMTKRGEFVVASGNAVTLWSNQGRLLHEYGKNNLRFCKNLSLNEEGIIAVTDADNDSAAMISLDGNWLHFFGKETDLCCPTGIGVLSNGDVAVADWKCRVQLFDRHGRKKLEFSERGKEDGKLDLPYGLTCDSKDNILVADWWNNRISVFNCRGQFIKHILAQSDGIKMPTHVCLQKNGNTLAILEFGSCEIKLFNFFVK